MRKKFLKFLDKAKTINYGDAFFFGCVSFIAGVFAFSVIDFNQVSEPLSGTLFFLGIIALAAFLFKKKGLTVFFISLLALVGGAWAIESQKKLILSHQENAGTSEGMLLVSRLPEKKDDYQKVVGNFWKDGKFSGGKAELTGENEKILLYASISDQFAFGDFIQLKCDFKVPENKYPKFNYVRFLAKSDIYKTCSYPDIQKRKSFFENPNPAFFEEGLLSWRLQLFNIIYGVREKLEQKIKENFEEPGAAYLAGLLLGGEDRLPEDVAENFRRTGTTHTVAVSGFNITIIASFFMWLAIFVGFWRPKAFWVSAVGITFFVLMIGSPSSAVRAAVMGLLVLWAAKNGRLSSAGRAIVFAAFLMIVFSPLMLVYDAGFQLSFLAAASLVFIYAPLSEKLEITNDFLGLKSIILMTIVAQAGVLGLIIYSFESLSLLTLIANTIILPAIPAIMLSGFIVIAISFFSPFLAGILAMPVQLLLDLEIFAVSWLAQFSFASIDIQGIPLWWLAAYYLVFAGLILRLNNEKPA